MEGKTHIEKIVGGNEEERSVAARVLQETYELKSKWFSKLELEKTPEDMELINRTETIVNDIVAQYNGDVKLVPPDHIFILPPGGVLEITGGTLMGGLHQPIKGSIAVEKGGSKLLFVSTLSHELFHLKSYKSARIGEDGEDVRLYRTGFAMYDKNEAKLGEEKEYFGMLEEAIVVECTRRALEKVRKEPEFAYESASSKIFMNWVISYYRRLGTAEKN